MMRIECRHPLGMLLRPFFVSLLLLWTYAFGLSFLAWASENQTGGVVLVSPLKGVVGIALESHLDEVLQAAKETRAKLLVLEIDTPGGLVSSMTEMSQKIADAPLPVVVWVYPSGARAASAGAFLVESAHVAAMAPGTHLGASHPVDLSGGSGGSKEMAVKITNDLAAQMRSLAQERNRNPEACAKMVTDSLSYTTEEALHAKVIDLVAANLNDLLSSVNGRKVLVQGRPETVDLARYEVRRVEMSERLQLLQFISSPDIAYLLLLAGVLAIVFEILSPGGFVMGITGLVCVLLGAYGMRMLPVNWAGIALLGAGVGIMVLDLHLGGMGILTALGIVALLAGGLIVYRAPGGELLDQSFGFLVGSILALAGFFAVALWGIWRSMKRKPASGLEGLVGTEVVTVDELDPEGMVSCQGEYWKATSANGERIEKGQRVRVLKVEGLSLLVEKIGEGEEPEASNEETR